MARSRRRRKYGRCICGRHLVPFIDNDANRRTDPGCPVLERVHDHNDRFLKFRELRSRPLDMGDD